jgi:N-acetylmuramoyl-L-alanine amidase
MSELSTLKRLLLRSAVQENLDIIKKRRTPQARHSSRPAPFTWEQRSLVLLLALSLVVISSGIFAVTGNARWTTFPSPEPEQQPPALTSHVATLPRPSFTPEESARLITPTPATLAAFPLAVRKIILDPGHGGHDLGTVAARGLTEKDVTLDIAHRLRQLLEESAITVLMTREQDEALALDQRTATANQWEGDLFVSIHVNWLTPHTLRGIETFYLGPTDDPALLHLARRENSLAAYSFAEVRQLLEDVFIDVRRGESRKLAETIQEELFTTLHEVNPALENRGVKSAPFAVLVGTEMPAILTEVSCLSNHDEALLLTSPVYRQEIAHALFRGILSYGKALQHPTQKGS